MRARPTLAALLALEATAVVAVARHPDPAPVDWRDPLGWLGRTDAETATLVVGRWLVLLVAGWLLLSTVVALGARLLEVAPGSGRRTRGLGRLLARGAPAAVRHLVEAAVAVGVVAATVAPAAAAPPGARTSPVPAAARPSPIPAAARPLVVPLGPVRDGRAATPSTPAPEALPPTATAPAPVPPTATAPAPAPGPTTVADGTATHHRVVEGEHLWGIAEAVVRARGGTDDPAAVDRYWRALCDANRDRLASGDPDVVAPGEDLDLPPVA